MIRPRTKEEQGVIDWLNDPRHVKGWETLGEGEDWKDVVRPGVIGYRKALFDERDILPPCETTPEDHYQHSNCFAQMFHEPVQSEAQHIATMIHREAYCHAQEENEPSHQCRGSVTCTNTRIYGHYSCIEHLAQYG